MPPEILEQALTYSIIGASHEVYNVLRFGFVESLYVSALVKELIGRGHKVGREVLARVYYKGYELGSQRLDMVVDEKVIVEVKTGLKLPQHASRQLFSYLKATRYEVGLLLYFGPSGVGAFRIVSSNPATSQSGEPM